MPFKIQIATEINHNDMCNFAYQIVLLPSSSRKEADPNPN